MELQVILKFDVISGWFIFLHWSCQDVRTLDACLFWHLDSISSLCHMLHMLYVQSLGINEIDVCFTEDDSFYSIAKNPLFLLSETCDFKRFRKWPWSSPEILRYLWRSIWRWSVRCGKAGLHHSLGKGWSGSINYLSNTFDKNIYSNDFMVVYWFYDCFWSSILVISV